MNEIRDGISASQDFCASAVDENSLSGHGFWNNLRKGLRAPDVLPAIYESKPAVDLVKAHLVVV